MGLARIIRSERPVLLCGLGWLPRCVTVELDFVFHVCESGRHCMGVYAYEVGTPRSVLGDYAANDIYRSVYFHNGVRGRLHRSGPFKFLLRLAKLLFGRKALDIVADRRWIIIDRRE